MRLAFLSIVLSLAPLAGCVRVKPYQREQLSLAPMSSAPEALEDHFRQHWQESREGAAGGYAAAGGGCGCN
jgi:hypothetical protein